MKLLTTLPLVLVALATRAHARPATTSSAAPSTPALSEDAAIKLYMAKLSNVTLNEKSPPKFSSPHGWQPVCAPVMFGPGGESVRFWHEASIYPDNIENKTALAIIHVDHGEFNAGAKTVSFGVKKSTTLSKEVTEGWTAGASVSNSFLGFGVEVSSSYEHKVAEKTEEELSSERTMECPPQHDCTIETWSFQLEITATSVLNPYYQLWSAGGGYGAKIPTCQMRLGEASCEQFKQRLHEWCDYSERNHPFAAWNYWYPGKWPPAALERKEKVEMSMPIYEENGNQLLTRVVRRQRPLVNKAREVSRDAKTETLESIAEAIEQGVKFEFLD
ncbi:hypothetical protein NHJ13051_005058 [Beauveria bassiana]